MQTIAQDFTALSDHELLRVVQTRALHEREVTAQIIAALAEIDARQLYLALRFNSLFEYCTACLHIGRETRDKLRRVQDLLRHAVPDGDPAVVFDRALTVLLADLEKKKFAQVERPQHVRASNAASRHVPAAVKREVWKRDGGRCAFLGSEGRCTETGFLEFHHVEPYADGGPTVASNLELRCRAHNAYEGFLHFGSGYVREAQLPYGLTPTCGCLPPGG